MAAGDKLLYITALAGILCGKFYNCGTEFWLLSDCSAFYTATATIILRLFWILSRYQKGKTILDLLEQEIVSGSGICWADAMLTPFDLLQGLPLQATHGFTSSPILHTRRVPPCMVQSRLGAIPR